MPHFPLTGGCLCGAVRYEATGGYDGCAHCHCRMCQQSAGAPIVTWFTIKGDHFRVTRGALKFYRSSEQAERGFCADCGTQIVFRYFEGNEGTDVTAASLDRPDAVEPEFQIFPSARIGWMHGFDRELPTRKHKFED